MPEIRSTSPVDFAARTEPFRRELMVHCYRMLGSPHEAEDLVQETYLRAWRGFDRFEGRSSVRTWLYRIATRACLNALESRARRALPSGLGAAGAGSVDRLGADLDDHLWLQPLPSAFLDDGDPATRAVARSRTRLAMIAALHTLSARERAAVLLRDVLAWPAAEVATVLETSTAAVNSSLQRARARLDDAEPAEDEIVEPDDPASRAMLDRYVAAIHDADIESLVGLLRDDVVIEMPPVPTWFAGRDRVGAFFASRVSEPGQWRMRRTTANGQPAAAGYLRRDDGVWHAHTVQVLTVRGSGIARVTAFRDARLFPYFGLPAVM